MLPRDLEQVEEHLSIRLPEDYRQVMLRYPFAPGSQAEELWLLDHPERIIRLNVEYRESGFFGLPWPATRFAVGGDGAGNAYALDLSRTPEAVLFADHEARTIEPIASNLASWIEVLQREEVEVEEDARQMAERHRTRRWWQVWR